MFRMIEIVGSSPAGFSEAVKGAIAQVVASGETVHFFEVVEERGSVHGGKFGEFQVKLKVAVDVSHKSAPEKQLTGGCPTCLQPAGEAGHLCAPISGKDKKCDWCGSIFPDARHLCNEKVKELAYICNTCGRTAVKAEHLCNPLKIGTPVKGIKPA
ncbi:MAG: dodecin domain-containing protein [Candidatus Omnitrophota bacterium]